MSGWRLCNGWPSLKERRKGTFEEVMVCQVDGWCPCRGDNKRKPNMVKTYLKARYRLSDLLRAQRNDRMTSSLKRWTEIGASDKEDLKGDSYKILKQFYQMRKDLVYLNEDGIVACKCKEDDKFLYKYNSIVLPQLYQTDCSFFHMIRWAIKA